MAYGTPAAPGDIERYYTHIRRGRPPTAGAARRPRAAATTPSAGSRPLAERTEAQRAAIAARARRTGARPVPGGARPEARRRRSSRTPSPTLAGRGVERVVGLVLAPHYSAASVGQYQTRAAEAAAEHGIDARRSTRGTASRPTSTSWRRPCATTSPPCRTARPSCSPPTPARAGARRRSVPRPAGRERGGRGRAPRPTRRPTGGSPGRAPGRTPEPWRGPDILDVLAIAGRAVTPPAWPCAPRASWRTTSRSSTTSTSRPEVWRSRSGLAFGRTAVAQRRPGRDGARSPDLVDARARRRRDEAARRRRRSGAGSRASPPPTRRPGSIRRRGHRARRRATGWRGKVLTTPFAGMAVDAGPDAFLARVPVGRRPVPGARASRTSSSARRRGRAYVLVRRALRALPDRHGARRPDRSRPARRAGLVARGRRPARRDLDDSPHSELRAVRSRGRPPGRALRARGRRADPSVTLVRSRLGDEVARAARRPAGRRRSTPATPTA